MYGEPRLTGRKFLYTKQSLHRNPTILGSIQFQTIGKENTAHPIVQNPTSTGPHSETFPTQRPEQKNGNRREPDFVHTANNTLNTISTSADVKTDCSVCCNNSCFSM